MPHPDNPRTHLDAPPPGRPKVRWFARSADVFFSGFFTDVHFSYDVEQNTSFCRQVFMDVHFLYVRCTLKREVGGKTRFFYPGTKTYTCPVRPMYFETLGPVRDPRQNSKSTTRHPNREVGQNTHVSEHGSSSGSLACQTPPLHSALTLRPYLFLAVRRQIRVKC